MFFLYLRHTLLCENTIYIQEHMDCGEINILGFSDGKVDGSESRLNSDMHVVFSLVTVCGPSHVGVLLRKYARRRQPHAPAAAGNVGSTTP